MDQELRVGAQFTATTTVTDTNTAAAVGSGSLQVFATPMMIALMENAAAACLAQFLPQGQDSVGTQVTITHDAATPLGMEVRATATIASIDRRKVEFSVLAEDSAGVVGKGTHTRFIIDVDRFLQKAAERGDN